jgi:hypothetical protein
LFDQVSFLDLSFYGNNIYKFNAQTPLIKNPNHNYNISNENIGVLDKETIGKIQALEKAKSIALLREDFD